MNQPNKWKRIGIIALSSGMTQFLTLAFGLLLVRKLDKIDYAVYQQGMLIIAMLIPFFAIISPISLSYFLSKAESKEEKKSYVYQTIFSFIMISLFGSIVLLIFKNQLGMMYGNDKLVKYIPTFSLILFFESIYQYFPYYMACIDKSKVLATFTFVFSFMKTGVLFYAAFFDKTGEVLKVFLNIYAIVVSLKTISALLYTKAQYVGVNLSFNNKLFYKQLIFSIPIYTMGIINAFNFNLDKNLVSMIYDPSKYAVYVNGAYQIPFVGILSNSVISVMLPDISSRFEEGNRVVLHNIVQEFRRMIKVQYVILFSLFISLFIFSKGAVIFLFSNKYLESVPIFKIYLFMLIFQSLNLGVLLTAADRQKDIVRAGIFMLVSNIILLVIISKTIGFNYLAFAPVCSTFLMNVGLLFSIKKIYLQNSIFNILPLKIIIASVFIGIIVVLLFNYIYNLIMLGEVLKSIILGPLCFITCLLLFRLFEIITLRLPKSM